MPFSVNTIPLLNSISKVINVYKSNTIISVQIQSSSNIINIFLFLIDFLSILRYTIIVKLNTPCAVVQIKRQNLYHRQITGGIVYL